MIRGVPARVCLGVAIVLCAAPAGAAPTAAPEENAAYATLALGAVIPTGDTDTIALDWGPAAEASVGWAFSSRFAIGIAAVLAGPGVDLADDALPDRLPDAGLEARQVAPAGATFGLIGLEARGGVDVSRLRLWASLGLLAGGGEAMLRTHVGSDVRLELNVAPVTVVGLGARIREVGAWWGLRAEWHSTGVTDFCVVRTEEGRDCFENERLELPDWVAVMFEVAFGP